MNGAAAFQRGDLFRPRKTAGGESELRILKSKSRFPPEFPGSALTRLKRSQSMSKKSTKTAETEFDKWF
jgi:hypothetical protein